MKTKKNPKILLALVIIVWGAIGFRALLLLNPITPELEPQEFTSNSNFKLTTRIDSFSISSVNRDPFLGTILKKQKSKIPLKKVKSIQWKPLIYQGTVKQDNSKQQIFIVSINGKQSLLKKGQTIDSVTLLHGNAKSITMRYKNQLKKFSIK